MGSSKACFGSWIHVSIAFINFQFAFKTDQKPSQVKWAACPANAWKAQMPAENKETG